MRIEKHFGGRLRLFPVGRSAVLASGDLGRVEGVAGDSFSPNTKPAPVVPESEQVSEIFGIWPDNLWGLAWGPGRIAARGGKLFRLRNTQWKLVRSESSRIFESGAVAEDGRMFVLSKPTRDCDATLVMEKYCTKAKQRDAYVVALSSNGREVKAPATASVYPMALDVAPSGELFVLGSDRSSNTKWMVWRQSPSGPKTDRVADNDWSIAEVMAGASVRAWSATRAFVSTRQPRLLLQLEGDTWKRYSLPDGLDLDDTAIGTADGSAWILSKSELSWAGAPGAAFEAVEFPSGLPKSATSVWASPQGHLWITIEVPDGTVLLHGRTTPDGSGRLTLTNP